MNTPSLWPVDLVARLEACIKRRPYPRQIGIELGKTRNAVIGAAKRRGWSFPRRKSENPPQRRVRVGGDANSSQRPEPVVISPTA